MVSLYILIPVKTKLLGHILIKLHYWYTTVIFYIIFILTYTSFL